MLYDGTPLYADVNGGGYMGDYGGSGSSTGSGGSTTQPGVSPDPNSTPPSGGGSTTPGPQREYPIDVFLKAQGTFCADDGMGGCAQYMAPVANYLAWSNPSGAMTAAVDYAGIANDYMMQNGQWMGTSIGGAVTETELPDGRSRVHVRLNGTDVSAYVVQGAGFSGSTLVGFAPSEPWTRPADPVRGSLEMEIVFINPYIGAPLPDLLQLIRAPWGGQQIELLRMKFDGIGRDRTSGERRSVSIVYDGSMGPIQPVHPSSPEKTGPTGTGRIMLY